MCICVCVLLYIKYTNTVVNKNVLNASLNKYKSNLFHLSASVITINIIITILIIVIVKITIVIIIIIIIKY